MKIRNGFVSNSSSCSFLVTRINFLDQKNRVIISKEIEDKVKKYGFIKTCANYAWQVSDDRWNYKYQAFEQWKRNVKYLTNRTDKELRKYFKGTNNLYNWGYKIDCNQDEVIDFLLKNKIPFSANIHYDQTFMRYDGNDTVTIAFNFGTLFEMAYPISELKKDYKPIQQMTVDDFKKKGRLCI